MLQQEQKSAHLVQAGAPLAPEARHDATQEVPHIPDGVEVAQL